MTIAKWVLIGITILITVSDVLFATNHKAGDTYSETILHYALEHPVIPFCFGVLAGHLMWPQFIK